MRLSRIITLTVALVFLFISLLATDYYFKLRSKGKISSTAPSLIAKEAVKLKSIAFELTQFNTDKKYNDEIAFIVDMNLPSGKNRFFVYDLKTNAVIACSLVTHGRCNKAWLSGRAYSNVIGSGCTSPGKYKIGKPYYGRFGLAYKLHGLDETNSNAYQRYVVLHAHDCVPEIEIDPYPLCQSDGCPTVSPGFLKRLQKIIDGSSKPLLLTISK